MIRFDGVSASYTHESGPNRRVLDDISLTLGDGEFVALMGRNGSGKTTLARLCNGLLLPASGTIHVDGLRLTPEDTSQISAIRRAVGMVFQNPENQIVSTTVEREIAFGLENLGLPRNVMQQRVARALRTFNLEDKQHHPPHQLSGGEKQLLALAAVVAMQPRHIVLDEPTALIDTRHRRRVLDILGQIRRGDTGSPCTLLYVTHHAEEALFADRLLILDAGRLVLDGPPSEIFCQETALTAHGIVPPLEFAVFAHLKKRKNPLTTLDDLRLKPIL